MTAKDAIKFLLVSTQKWVHQYVSDLSDDDLLVRPVPAANPIAWQLGHMIASEVMYFQAKVPGVAPVELPAGFAERHANETAAKDPPTGFLKKDEYLALFDRVRGATLAAVDRLSDADLDKESGWGDYAPTVGTLLLRIGDHDMMHAGQFTVLRRKLGKPVLV